jgi:Ca-activated chloride channel family protein
MMKRPQYNLKGLIIFLVIIELIFWPVFFSLKYYLSDNDKSFRFEFPDMLWLLLLIPVFLFVSVLQLKWKNSKMVLFAEPKLLSKISSGNSTSMMVLSIFLIRMSMFAFIIAIANPQYGVGERTAKSEGVDIIIALDISNSMLTQDGTNDFNRLKSAKIDIERLINNLAGDRLGLIVFAGMPVVQLPVTHDLAASKFFLSGINTEMISVQGTDIGGAISLAIESFPADEKRQKALIVITDGENHEQDAVFAAREAKNRNIIVHTIGFGSEKGAPVPNYVNGEYKGLKRDKDGNTVISKLNMKLLSDIASAGGGMSILASGGDSPLEIIRKELRKMEQTEVESISYPEYEDRFQIFIVIAIVLLLIEMILPNHSFDLFTKIITNAK